MIYDDLIEKRTFFDLYIAEIHVKYSPNFKITWRRNASPDINISFADTLKCQRIDNYFRNGPIWNFPAFESPSKNEFAAGAQRRYLDFLSTGAKRISGERTSSALELSSGAAFNDERS